MAEYDLAPNSQPLDWQRAANRKEVLVIRFLLLPVLCCLALSAAAKDHIVKAGPGQAQSLFASGQVSSGDRIVLEDGYHGTLTIAGYAFNPPVTLTRRNGQRPQFDQLSIINSHGLRIVGLTVIPQKPELVSKTMVRVQDSKHVHLSQLSVATTRNSKGWTARQWVRRARDGVLLSGQDVSITNSFIKNTRHGIIASANRANVENNVVDTFSGDGMRGLGDNSLYIGNTIRTCVDVDDNHDDGFQSWSVNKAGQVAKGVVRNVRLERNLIENGNHPLKCSLQGIGLFGGFYEDWVIRHNTVIVDHWHGITVMGARNVVISQNVVVDSRPGKPGAPWIAITAHRDGRLSKNSVIKNNISQQKLKQSGSKFVTEQPGVRRQGNVVANSPQDALRYTR